MIKQKQGYILRNIMGEQMLCPTGTEMQKFKGSIIMNELAAFIWNSLQTPVDIEYLETLIISEYDVDEEQVKADLRTILDTFNEYGIIEYI